jgi:hypothetical protein
MSSPATDGTHGLFERARRLREALNTQPPTQMDKQPCPQSGTRSVTTLPAKNTIEVEPNSPQTPSLRLDVDTVLEQVKALRPGQDPAIPLFTILRSVFSVKKGAFLLPQTIPRSPDEAVLLPYAVRGYDETTKTRLRLPVSRFGQTRLITGDGLTAMRPYFSMREYDMLRRVVCIPFRDGRTVLGCCLISDPALTQDQFAQLEQFLRHTHDSISSYLASCIPNRLREGHRPRISHHPALHEIVESVSRLAGSLSNRGNRLLLLKIRIDNLIDSVCRISPDAVPFRVREEIYGLLDRMVSGVGEMFIFDTGSVLLAITFRSVGRPEMFVHQIRGAVGRMYSAEVPMPDYQTGLVSGSDSEISTLVTDLTS